MSLPPPCNEVSKAASLKSGEERGTINEEEGGDDIETLLLRAALLQDVEAVDQHNFFTTITTPPTTLISNLVLKVNPTVLSGLPYPLTELPPLIADHHVFRNQECLGELVEAIVGAGADVSVLYFKRCCLVLWKKQKQTYLRFIE